MQAYPLDLVRTRLSAQVNAQYYNGIASALRTIVRDEGLTGLYRGLGATMAQVMLLETRALGFTQLQNFAGPRRGYET